jgi:hypothetical protein
MPTPTDEKAAFQQLRAITLSLSWYSHFNRNISLIFRMVNLSRGISFSSFEEINLPYFLKVNQSSFAFPAYFFFQDFD